MVRRVPERTDSHAPDGGFATQMIDLAGQRFVADRSGALFEPSARTLIVADLHLEKGSAFAARGRMLPPYDTRETLARLAAVIERYAPQRVIALGDSLHDTGAAARIDRADLATLGRLQEGRAWVWVTGNHDPVIGGVFGGRIVDQIAIGSIILRHEPVPRAQGSASAALKGRCPRPLDDGGTSLRRPCFVSDGQCLVMPAFGAFTGGLNVLDEAFLPLFGQHTMRVWMLGRDGVYPVPLAQLGSD